MDVDFNKSSFCFCLAFLTLGFCLLISLLIRVLQLQGKADVCDFVRLLVAICKELLPIICF